MSDQNVIELLLKAKDNASPEVKKLREDLKKLGDIDALKKQKRQALESKRAWQQAQDQVQELARAMKEGGEGAKGLAKDFKKAQANAGRLKATYTQNRDSLQKLRTSLAGAGVDVKNLTSEEKKLRQAADRTEKKLLSQAKSSARLKGAVGSLKKSFLSLKAVMLVVLAAFSFKEIVEGLFSAGTMAQRLRRSMVAITGSVRAAADELAWLRRTADELGQEFYIVAGSYKAFLASVKDTELAGQAAREVFRAVLESSTALGMSIDDTEGALRAFVQMVSKGNVQAEELRGQLGERLYGAFNLAAKAMGKTTPELNKMLERGEVLAKDLLPRLARLLHEKYGQAALDASNDAQAGVNRFTTAWTDLKVNMAEGGFLDSATQALRNLTTVVKEPGTQQAMRDFATTLGNIVESLTKLATYAGPFMYDFFVTSKQARDLKEQGLLDVDLDAFAEGSSADRRRMIEEIIAERKKMAAELERNASYYAYRPQEATTPEPVVTTPQPATPEAAQTLTDLSTQYDRVRIAAENYYAVANAKANADGNLTEVQQLQQALTLRQAQVRETAMLADQEAAEKVRAVRTSTLAEKEAAKAIEKIQTDLVKAKQQAYQQSLDALRQSLDQALALEKQYAEEVKRIKQEIADLDMSLQDKIRSLRQRDMTEEDREADLALQAEEKIAASGQALESGDSDQARKLAQQAGNIAYGLTDTEQAIDLLTRASGAEKNVLEDQLLIAEQNLASAQRVADELQKSLVEVRTSVEADPITVTFDVDTSAVDAVLARLEKVRERGIRVGVGSSATVPGYATGGLMGGYGGGDRLLSLLEPGEFVIRKEAVRQYGASVFDALNTLSLPTADAGISRFADGGPVEPSETVNLNFKLGGNTYRTTAEKNVAEALKRTFGLEYLKTGGRRPSWEG